MRDNPERLAWIILLASFFACVGLIVAVPLGIRHYILHASVRQDVTLEVQRGPLRVTLSGRGEPVAIDEERDEIPENTAVATDATAGRLVMYAPQANGPVVAGIQIYDNTETIISSARSPRFPASRLPHRITMEVKGGRVRISVLDDDERATVVEVKTPHGACTLLQGSYEVKVNGTRMEVTVRNGQALLTNNDEDTVYLGPDERATIDRERVVGPLPAARDLDPRAPPIAHASEAGTCSSIRAPNTQISCMTNGAVWGVGSARLLLAGGGRQGVISWRYV